MDSIYLQSFNIAHNSCNLMKNISKLPKTHKELNSCSMTSVQHVSHNKIPRHRYSQKMKQNVITGVPPIPLKYLYIYECIRRNKYKCKKVLQLCSCSRCMEAAFYSSCIYAMAGAANVILYSIKPKLDNGKFNCRAQSNSIFGRQVRTIGRLTLCK